MVGLSRELRILRDALLFFILVDFPSRGIGKIKKGIPDSAESGSGLCPENPQTFEKV